MPVATDCTTLRANLTPARKQRLRRRLLSWYAENARDLPWRRSHDPYFVWLSEIMLQQTQVATVCDYFERFLRELPTIQRLAAADEQQVLRLWEGLGYYRRARQLHAAARKIVAELGGELPDDVERLQDLPGIGRYTAGAIASIAFGRPAAILEANTIRLLSRLIGYRGDVTTSGGRRALWQTAEEFLPRENAARFNQALMELGSLVCTPTNPRCDDCPLETWCAARAAGLQHAIPRAKPRKRYTELHEAAVVIRKCGRVLVRQCGRGERWAGLWDFPRCAVEAEGPLLVLDEIVAKVRAQTGVTCSPGPLIKTIKHGVTRYRITLDCFEAKYVKGVARSTPGLRVKWLRVADLVNLPFSSSGRKIARLLGDNRRK
jgi:A/G-specific adenine glycosylase